MRSKEHLSPYALTDSKIEKEKSSRISINGSSADKYDDSPRYRHCPKCNPKEGLDSRKKVGTKSFVKSK